MEKTRHVVQAALAALLVAGFSLLMYLAYQQNRAKEIERCQAVQQTILDEAELIAAGGKFPGDQVTDRWKKLLGGCND